MSGVFPKFVIGAALVVAASAAAFAQATTDPATLLKEIQELRKKQAAAKVQSLTAAGQGIAAAAKSEATAVQYYAEAVKVTELGSDANRFRDWKKANKDVFSDKVVQAAVRMHMRYLLLSMSAAAQTDPKALPPVDELFAYLKDLAMLLSAVGDIGGGGGGGGDRNPRNQVLRSLLFESVADGPIARATGVSGLVANLSGDNPNASKWELVPGRWSAINATNLRAPLRAHKDPRLFVAWQMEIERTKAGLNNRKDWNQVDVANVKVPSLQWDEAMDMVMLGKSQEGLAEMERLIKTYPQHPDFAKWIDSLEVILKAMAPPEEAPAPAPPGKDS